jgi:predicted amidohydrolase
MLSRYPLSCTGDQLELVGNLEREERLTDALDVPPASPVNADRDRLRQVESHCRERDARGDVVGVCFPGSPLRECLRDGDASAACVRARK